MSTYNPTSQGRKDGLRGKPRFHHVSAWSQQYYDAAYDAAVIEAKKQADADAKYESERDWTIRELMEKVQELQDEAQQLRDRVQNLESRYRE